MAAKDVLGKRGERLAEQFLTDAGLVILDRNWRCQQGEIDLVARDGDELVFVEVKTRTSTAFGHPLEAITALKLARLRRLAAAWCAEHGTRVPGVRLDAVAVLVPPSGEPVLEHLRGIF